MKLKNFKIRIKDTSKHERLEYLQKYVGSLCGYMNIRELYDYHMAEHIMDYKIILHKLIKRIMT